MTNDTMFIHNADTNEVVVRELTDEEQLERNAEVSASLAARAEKKTKKEQDELAKAALLSKLGITEDEAKLLLGGN